MKMKIDVLKTWGICSLTMGLWWISMADIKANDWPQWQGPNRDGVSLETGLLDSWPAGGPELLWKQDNLGASYSTPAVAQGKVIGMGYRGDDEVVWALDETTGKELWSTVTTRAYTRMSYPEGPRSTPTVDGLTLYSLGAGGNLACLTLDEGRVLWQRQFKEEFGGRMMSGWGYSESVLVDGDKVVCTPGAVQGSVVALNKKSGELIWQSKGLKDKAAYTSIIAVDHGGVRQYIVFTEKRVAGLAAEDGSVLWEADRPGRVAVIPTPIFHDGHVYVTSGYGVGCDLFRIDAEDGKFSTTQVYQNKTMENHHGGVVRIGEYLYGYSDRNKWTCQEFKTGKEVWSHEGVGKGSITYADGHLYIRSERGEGTVALIEATPKGYVEKGRFDQPERSSKNSWPHPVVAQGKLLIRDQGLLLCYKIGK